MPGYGRSVIIAEMLDDFRDGNDAQF